MAGFKFKLDGLRATVLAALPAQQSSPVNDDQSFMPPLVEFIAAEIGKLDAKFNGALVIANGEFSKQTGRTVATIQIYAKQL
jgi:hypothetical protein